MIISHQQGTECAQNYKFLESMKSAFNNKFMVLNLITAYQWTVKNRKDSEQKQKKEINNNNSKPVWSVFSIA